MKQYEMWANRLYPKYTFKDVLKRIERLSTTKEFKVHTRSCPYACMIMLIVVLTESVVHYEEEAWS